MDAEQKGVTDPRIRSWLDKLQNISYDIDEMFNVWGLEILKRQIEELKDASGLSDPWLKKIAKAILEARNGDSPNLFQFETLLQRIKDSISGKRFILVLDDVWTEDDTMWKPLRISLINDGAPGSRTLVTTRKTKVAKIMGSTSAQIQSLAALSDSYCWSILSRIAFPGRNEGDCEMLKETGWEIALKCKGLPLAAKSIGGVLRFKTSQEEWQNVLKSQLWALEKMKEVVPILALIYNELHHALLHFSKGLRNRRR